MSRDIPKIDVTGIDPNANQVRSPKEVADSEEAIADFLCVTSAFAIGVSIASFFQWLLS